MQTFVGPPDPHWKIRSLYQAVNGFMELEMVWLVNGRAGLGPLINTCSHSGTLAITAPGAKSVMKTLPYLLLPTNFDLTFIGYFGHLKMNF